MAADQNGEIGTTDTPSSTTDISENTAFYELLLHRRGEDTCYYLNPGWHPLEQCKTLSIIKLTLGLKQLFHMRRRQWRRHFLNSMAEGVHFHPSIESFNALPQDSPTREHTTTALATLRSAIADQGVRVWGVLG